MVYEALRCSTIDQPPPEGQPHPSAKRGAEKAVLEVIGMSALAPMQKAKDFQFGPEDTAALERRGLMYAAVHPLKASNIYGPDGWRIASDGFGGIVEKPSVHSSV